MILEYEEILKREKDQLTLTFEEIDDVIDGICSIANFCDIFYLWRPASSDPDDDFLIDLAVEARADFIITYNQKDLQAAKTFGINIVTPNEFLQQVGEIP